MCLSGGSEMGCSNCLVAWNQTLILGFFFSFFKHCLFLSCSFEVHFSYCFCFWVKHLLQLCHSKTENHWVSTLKHIDQSIEKSQAMFAMFRKKLIFFNGTICIIYLDVTFFYIFFLILCIWSTLRHLKESKLIVLELLTACIRIFDTSMCNFHFYSMQICSMFFYYYYYFFFFFSYLFYSWVIADWLFPF